MHCSSHQGSVPLIRHSLLPLLAVTSGMLLPLRAQTQEKREPITTDRPDFTEAAIIVPQSWLQIENGFTYQNGGHVYTLSGTETLFRYGLTHRFEVRLGLPDTLRRRESGRTESGFGDTYLGAKYQLGPTKNGWDISVIPAVFLPTGRRAFSSGTIEPEIKFCFGKDLNARLDVSGMLYVSLPTEQGRRNSTLQSTLSFGYALGGPWRTFFEYAGTFSQHGGPEHLAHSGFAYLLNNDTQLDLHYGVSLNPGAPQSFVGAGLSFRFNTR